MSLNNQQMLDYLRVALVSLDRAGAVYLPIGIDQLDMNKLVGQLPATQTPRKDVRRDVGGTAAAPQPKTQIQPPAKVEGDDSWARLNADLKDCRRCKLASGRQNIVVSRGNPNADLMFIGEGPGRDEDRQGQPFVGQAGQLLDKIITAMGFAQDEIYIANIVKCRPPQNRNPEDDEVATCLPFLQRQIELVKPKVICLLGSVALKSLIGSEERISRVRGKFLEYCGVPTLPTYHPAFLLRKPDMKRAVWQDVQKISAKLGRNTVQAKGGKT
jgi:DNA polymerase